MDNPQPISDLLDSAPDLLDDGVTPDGGGDPHEETDWLDPEDF